MRALRALFRGWLNHPWRAFWLSVLAFYAGLFSLVLVAPPPAALSVGPVFVIGVVLILLASAVRGLQVSWRRSRRGAVINVGVPILLLVLISGGGALMREHMVGRARHANASADARALADAVTKYAAHMGRLPNALTELTAPATNAKGETAGPFIERLPTPPSHWTEYRYRARADGTFSIVSDGEGRTIAFPAP